VCYSDAPITRPEDVYISKTFIARAAFPHASLEI
jgi:hypothetical protein